MNPKDRELVGPLDQLHGGGVARVYLDRVGHALPSDEVDTIQTDQTQPGCEHGGGSSRQLQEFGLSGEQLQFWTTQNAAAVPKPSGPKSRIPYQLAAEPQDSGISPIGRKRD
jgi:hypothetical protein